MKRTNQLILLVLIFCGASWAQALTSITISTAPSGPVFVVDGTPYTSPQVFEWPIGSYHVVQFPLTFDSNGIQQTYQSQQMDNIHYVFSSWVENTGLLGPAGSPVQTVTADPTVTTLTANVTVFYRVRVLFNNSGTTGLNNDCSGAPSNPPQNNGLRMGIVYVDNGCIGDSTDYFMTAGVHTLNAFPYPGWVFDGFLIGNTTPSYLRTFNVTTPMIIIPQFSIGKRVNFITNPLGLNVLVDGAIIQTPSSNTAASDGTSCGPDYSRLPPGAPPGFTPLCFGQFDMRPGSQHRIAVQTPQIDIIGNYWAFGSFSNGLPQNGTYTADSNTNVPDTIVATFAPGVHVGFLTAPAGLKLAIDGVTNLLAYTFIWGVGETHTVSAAPQQSDAHARSYQFLSWSNSGSPTQTVTVPAVKNLILTANYQVLSQVQVTSTPSGLSFTIDGSPCVTPCVVNKTSGSQMQVAIPASISTGPGSRLDFDSWSDGGTGVSRQVSFNQDMLALNVSYHASYLLSMSSDPANGVNFKTDTASPDGYYQDGTQVTVTAVAKNGFKFRRWGGDLSGTYASGTLTMSSPHSAIALLDAVPYISPAGIQNAAGPTPDGTVAAGSIISIYGNSLAASLQVGPANPLAQTLANVTVTVNDQLLPLFFVSSQQINAQLPSSLPAGDYTLIVHSAGQSDVTGTFTISRDAPGIFTQPNDQNLPLVLALHQDGTVVNLSSPALRNETISIYGTGFGPYASNVTDGFPVAATTLVAVSDPVTLTLGGTNFQPDWTGAAPTFVGMTLVKLTIADSMPTAANVDMVISVNGKTSTKVTLPLQ
jgi:uncharacterized protein (TIGR03437 family)